MIKKIVLIAAMGTMGFLWGSGDVTIQVINAVKEKSITSDFEKKLKKTGLAVHKAVEGGRYIVTLGSYKDHKSAQKALKRARLVVSGAFVRPVKRDHIAVIEASAHHEKPKVQAPAAPHADSKAAVVAQVAGEAVVAEVVEMKSSPAVLAKSDIQAAFEKKEAYKSEIASAINFYKNSPYHRFEPVKLQ